MTVRPYAPGDETRIVPFLERYMDWPAVQLVGSKLDHWRWKYLANPLGFQLVCIAENAGEVISHSASVPVMLKVGDRTVVASQGVDLCTHPEFRGHGLIVKTMAVRNRLKDEHGVDIDFGFPNQAAYHVSSIKQGFRDLGVRMLQHQYIVDEDQFFGRLRFGSLKRVGYDSLLILRRSLGARTGYMDGVTIEGIPQFGPDVDHLYRKAAANFDLIIERSSTYLNWRYSDIRAGMFIVRRASRNGSMIGYMVHKVEERGGTRYLNIVDALVDPSEDHAIHALLKDAIKMSKDLRIETVLCCLPEGHPYGRAFSDLGFFSQERFTGGRPMSMIWFDRSKGTRHAGALERSPRCHVVLGDTDWV